MSVYQSAAKKTTTRTSRSVTPQSQPIPGREKDMVQNNAGGYTFEVKPLDRLRRFLILGTENNTAYTTAQKLTEDNTQAIKAIVSGPDGLAAVQEIVNVSLAGRAPKQEPTLFALALALTYGSDDTKRAASAAITQVARTGTMLFILTDYLNNMRGWGKVISRGVAEWYNSRSPIALAKQVTKYANRNGWTHKDVLRLAHVKPKNATVDAIFGYVCDKPKPIDDLVVCDYLDVVKNTRTMTDVKQASKLIADYSLPFEVLNTELLNSPEIWNSLLLSMGLTAMIRNLGKMSSIGLLTPGSVALTSVLSALRDEEALRQARIHPIKVLEALRVYQRGHGTKGNLTWTPNSKIVAELDSAFYRTFKNVEPTGLVRSINLDVSGSMWQGQTGIDGLTAAEVCAVLSMVTVRTEDHVYINAFTEGIKDISDKIHANMSLDEVTKNMKNIYWDWMRTDCAQPMIHATRNNIVVDSFEVYTDNETWFGSIHPMGALRNYRRAINPKAKLVVMAATPTNFTIADPNDSGSLDVAGFDSASPEIIAGFLRGSF